MMSYHPRKLKYIIFFPFHVLTLILLITQSNGKPISRRAMSLQAGPIVDFSVQGPAAAYPRVNHLSNGKIIGVYTNFPTGQQVLTIVTSSDNGASWHFTGTAARKDVSSGSLDNGYLIQLSSGRILLAFRNHDQDTSGRTTVYRITICKSDDLGVTWKFHSDAVVVTATPTKNGVWEPYMRNARDGSIQLYYSHERSATDQDSVMLSSTDGGVTWGNERLISGQVENGSRDGMVGIAEIGGQNLVAIFETNLNGGPFFLDTVSSSNDGATWGKRQTVYKSPPGKNAGAPQIALVGNTLIVSFMTDEDNNLGTAASWIEVADAKMLTSMDGGGTWAKTTVFQEPAFWPGLLSLKDNQSFLYLAGSNGLKSIRYTI